MSRRELELIRDLAERIVEAIEDSDDDYAVECAVSIIEIADQADADVVES